MRDQPENAMVAAILAVATRANHAMDQRDKEVKEYQVIPSRDLTDSSTTRFIKHLKRSVLYE